MKILILIQVNTPLGRCAPYTNFSCCSSADEEALNLWVEEEGIEETYSDPECMEKLNSLFCGGLCSPCQNSFISVGANGTVFTVCQDFCESIYASCSNASVFGNVIVKEVFTSEQFCKAVAPLDFSIEVVSSGSCFSGDDSLESCSPGMFSVLYFHFLSTNLKEPASRLSTVECPTDNCLYPFTVGEMIRFDIQAIDEEGNPITVGGDSFTVQVEGPGFVSPQVLDNQNGVYTAMFWTYLSGDYIIRTYLGSDPEPLQECEIVVKPGTTTSCVLNGKVNLALEIHMHSILKPARRVTKAQQRL